MAEDKVEFIRPKGVQEFQISGPPTVKIHVDDGVVEFDSMEDLARAMCDAARLRALLTQYEERARLDREALRPFARALERYRIGETDLVDLIHHDGRRLNALLGSAFNSAAARLAAHGEDGADQHACTLSVDMTGKCMTCGKQVRATSDAGFGKP